MDDDMKESLPEDLPGHLIRRMQQVSVSLFLQALHELDITPIQYLALTLVKSYPGIDQVSLSGRMALDTSTVADVAQRLVRKGFLVRTRSETDRRTYALHLTEEGERTVHQAQPLVKRARTELLSPLEPKERSLLIDLMCKVLQEHDVRFSLEQGAPWSRSAIRSQEREVL